METRYKFKSYEELCTRVSKNIGIPKLFDLMMTKKFIPAGNTLMAGVQPVYPNCSVLPKVTNDNFKELCQRSQAIWSSAIGIGFVFDINLENVIEKLQCLSDINAAIEFDHRPQRGNIVIMDANAPYLEDVLKYKATKNLYNFNLSVVVKKGCKVNELIAKYAWKCGCPGVIFMDFDNGMGAVPCGEQVISYNETCTLGCINLVNVNLNELESVVKDSLEILDHVIDIMEFPDKDLEIRTKDMRRIGLGLMGWGDLLENMGIPYNSPDALNLIDSYGKVFADAVKKWRPSGCKVTCSCIPPTGGITTLAGNKYYSIEPSFNDFIPYEDHLMVLSRWQQYIENSIAKTVNMPMNSTIEDVFECFNKASVDPFIKSVTIYRDESRKGQPMRCKRCAE